MTTSLNHVTTPAAGAACSQGHLPAHQHAGSLPSIESVTFQRHVYLEPRPMENGSIQDGVNMDLISMQQNEQNLVEDKER